MTKQYMYVPHSRPVRALSRTWVDGNGATGNESRAYSVIGIDQLEEGDFTSTHELGHNFGCDHDGNNAGGNQPEYAHGLRRCSGNVRCELHIYLQVQWRGLVVV